MQNPSRGSNERGFILLIAMVASILPLIIVLGATSLTMKGRQSRINAELDDERALMSTESGIDYALFRASTSLGLVSGANYARDLGDGMSFVVTPIYLRSDGIDNDGDGSTDETDENLYRVLAVGKYRNVTRRVVAYFGPQPAIGTFSGAITCLDSGYQIQIQDAATMVSGMDRKMDGSLAPGPHGVGVAVQGPTTPATLLSWLEDDHGHVQGITPTPSVGPSTAPNIDWNATKLAVQNAADVVLTADQYEKATFGNAATNQFKLIYRSGKLQLKDCVGAGVLFVTGDLQIQTNFRFDGIIYVGGKLQLQGNPRIYGSIVVGTNCEQIQVQGNSQLFYSSEAIAKASAVLPGKYVIFNGWQEISRK